MSKKQTTRIVLIVIIVVVLVGAFLINKFVLNRTNIPDDHQLSNMKTPAGAPAQRVIPVMVAVADYEEVMDGITAVGVLVANEEVEITSEVAGKVISISFKEGNAVSKGQTLVKLNDDDLQAQLKRLSFQEKTLAERLERQRILFEKEAISRETYDQVQTEYNVLLADMDLINVRIDKTEIRAPFSGVIGFRYISEGSYLQPGGLIAQLVDYNTLKLEFSISEKYAGLPLTGRSIYFTAQNDTKTYKAQIYAIEPKVDGNTRTLVLRGNYNNASGTLRPGMSIDITIPTAEGGKGLMIPTEAIVPSATGQNAWILKNGQPHLIPVEIGIRTPLKVEITQGVEKGDSVVVTGIMQLRERSQVEVTN